MQRGVFLMKTVRAPRETFGAFLNILKWLCYTVDAIGFYIGFVLENGSKEDLHEKE